MKPVLVFPISLCLFAFACSTNLERPVVKREGKADVVQVHKTDPEMSAAIDRARKTTNDFLAALKSPKPNQTDFSVKFPFDDGQTVEHMWVTELTIKGNTLSGILSNYPKDIRNYSYGQPVNIDLAGISDWKYVEDGRLVGGFTLRVMFNGYSPEQLREVENSLGYKIE